MRTYTVRDVLGDGADTRLVVDLVVHADGRTAMSGPAAPGPPAPRSGTGWC